jgi:hypothetical protein
MEEKKDAVKEIWKETEEDKESGGKNARTER